MLPKYNNITPTASTTSEPKLDPVTGTLIATGVAAVGNQIGGLAQRKWQREENERTYQRNLEQWHRENAYNDPSQQMARLKAAGLNPNMVYGTGTQAAGKAGSSPQKQSVQSNMPMPELGNFVNAALTMAQTKSIQLDNLDKEITLGLRKPLENEAGETTDLNYVTKFNNAIKAAEDALTAYEQRILTSKKVDAQELENRILKVRADLAEVGINFSNDNPIIRAIITALAQQGITMKDITAQLIKKYL